MSSQNQATCQTTPLLEDSQPAYRSSNILSRVRFRFSPETLLIPVVIATRLGNVIPSTTLFELLRQTLCRLSTISQHDTVTPELCGSPEVVRDFATVIAILGAFGGISSIVGCGILGYISPRYGRKPAFLFMLITELTWSCLIPMSQFMPGRLADWVFLLGILFHAFSDALSYIYIVDLYIVDVCAPEERTATLSKIGGWTALGVWVPHALGGSITTRTGNPFIVFYIAVVIFIALIIYVVSVLPESFPEEKRKALSRMHSQYSASSIPPLLIIFEPLKILVPTRTSRGTRNWRLTWCSIHMLVYTLGHYYASSAWQVLVTSKYYLTPADTGLFFTSINASNMLVLTVIIPPVVRFLRPYYRRRPRLADGGVENNEASKPEATVYLDVHLAFMASVIAGISYLCASVSSTTLTLILSGSLVGFAKMHSPADRSIVAGSIHPLRQGEALAAIEMVRNAGKMLSPIIMGSIFAATIDKAPMFFFYMQMVILLFAAMLLLLIRDADGYHKSDEI